MRERPRFLHVFVPIIITLGVVLVLGIILTTRHRDRLKTEALDRLDAIATVQEARIQAGLSENFNVDLIGLLTRSDISDTIEHLGGKAHDPDRLELLSAELTTALNPAFADLLVADTDGIVLASTDEQRLATHVGDDELLSAAAEVPTSGSFSLNSRGELIHTVAGPIKSIGGDTHILVLESREDDLLRLASDYTGLGASGETVLAIRNETGEAVFIVPLRFDADAAFSRLVGSTELNAPITQAFRNNEHLFTEAVDYRGVAVVAATRFVPLGDVGMVVKIDRSEAFATIDRLGTDLATSFSALTIFTMLLGAGLVRLLNRQDRLRRLSNVFEEAVDPMIMIDQQGTMLDVNPQAVESYGWARRELVGKSIEMLTPDEYTEALSQAHTASLTGTPASSVEAARITKSGPTIPVLISVSVLTDAAGHPIAAVTVEKDMSEILRVQRELEAAKEVAEEANRAKSEFLSRMSHELRTPLNSVIGFAQILELTLAEHDDLESVAYIRAGGEHLLSMVEDLLDLSRIDAGTLNPSLTPVPIHQLTGECLGLVRPQLGEKRVEVVTSPGPERHVLADHDQLRQVILNLMSNAIKFNHVGGNITIGTTLHGSTARWSISDTGVGIGTRHLGNLFKPFERLGADGSGVPGTGLGLALSKTLIERMGGSIGVHTVEGEGSTFWFDLPVSTTTSNGNPISGPEGASRAFPALEGSVLYIDDDVESVHLIKHVAERFAETKLRVAVDGSSGVRQARQHRPDLILLGSKLKDLPSLAVLAQLRNDPATMDIPVALVSTGLSDGQMRRFFSAGVVHHVAKPIDLQILSVVLERYLHRTPTHAGS